jgi:alkylation response protein AidB-like acyl-CoA dehydrogenase
MDLNPSQDEIDFRETVRTWIADNLPPAWRQGGDYREIDDEGDRAIQRAWQRKMYEGGWLTMTWSIEDGGKGATPVMAAILQEELARAAAPELLGRTGAMLHAPLINGYGSDYQRETYLRDLLSGDIIFAQSFSEPDAGSDMASLRTRAERVDGGWRITGQKTWNGGAHYADRALMLARSNPDAERHKGIGMFIVDLHQPGVEARPIRQMMGRSLSTVTGSGEFCDVFLDGAFVADEDVVGAPDEGWLMAMRTLGFERNGLTNSFRFSAAAARLTAAVAQTGLENDSDVRQRLGRAIVEAEVFRLTALRNLTAQQRGGSPGPEASITKLYWSEMDQRMQDFAIWLQGPYGALDPSSSYAIDGGAWQYSWMWSQAVTIYGGTSNIQRNQLAERVLGLPRNR